MNALSKRLGLIRSHMLSHTVQMIDRRGKLLVRCTQCDFREELAHSELLWDSLIPQWLLLKRPYWLVTTATKEDIRILWLVTASSNEEVVEIVRSSTTPYYIDITLIDHIFAVEMSERTMEVENEQTTELRILRKLAKEVEAYYDRMQSVGAFVWPELE